MKRFWQITNILALIFAVVMNALVGAQLLSVPSIGEVSDMFATYLTPATYAFSIWSLIYLLLAALIVYQARDLFKPNEDNDLPSKLGPLFLISSISNGVWTYAFVQEMIGLSVFILLTLTASLYGLIYKLRVATFDGPLSVIAFVWWPLAIYTGWVTVALVVNVASWMESLDVTLSPLASSLTLVVLMVFLLFLLVRRNVRELLLASGWGIAAIAVRQIQDDGSVLVAVTAAAATVALVVASGIHGYRHRSTSPLRKATKSTS